MRNGNAVYLSIFRDAQFLVSRQPLKHYGRCSRLVIAQPGRAPASDAGGCRIEACHPDQFRTGSSMGEPAAHNGRVAGSIRARCTRGCDNEGDPISKSSVVSRSCGTRRVAQQDRAQACEAWRRAFDSLRDGHHRSVNRLGSRSRPENDECRKAWGSIPQRSANREDWPETARHARACGLSANSRDQESGIGDQENK
jgi:hypothetical protein